MITIRLRGGLGNQMFQYALGRHLAIKHNTSFQLDTDIPYEIKRSLLLILFNKKRHHDYYVLNIFNINKTPYHFFNLLRHFIKIIPKIYRRKYTYMPTNSTIEEKYFCHYNPSILKDTPKNAYLIGYWQNPAYFKDIEHILRKDFTFRKPLMPQSLPVFQKIQTTTSVCLHVRRGDYLDKEGNANQYNVVSDKPSYFVKSAEYLTKRINDKLIHFFVFSDDIEWCIKNIKLPYPTTFISKDHAGKKAENHLQLMKNCKHFIISNSTFSWWGAWLSDNPDKIVIAPKKWFNMTQNTEGITPPEWIRL